MGDPSIFVSLKRHERGWRLGGKISLTAVFRFLLNEAVGGASCEVRAWNTGNNDENDVHQTSEQH